MIDRDDYGEPLPAKECHSCRKGEHMFCWGCGCPCNRDDERGDEQRDPGDESDRA